MKPLHNFKKAAKKAGFTLIELSIVLVIIGLIVGGILVGQDLIKAAEIRSTISQMEKYATAVNTFRSKYNGLPGDLRNAGNFGFDSGGTDSGDGDAVIESAASGGSDTFAGEVSCFWDQLSTASMISDSLNANTACGTSAVSTMNGAIPQSKLGRGNYLLVGSNAGINYWGLTGVTALASNVYTFDDLLTGSEAFQIDSKIDDGAPTSGSVMAMGAGATNATPTTLWTTSEAIASAAAGICVSAAGVYSFATNSGNDQACQLRLRSNF